MADYYPLLARAVAALPDSTPDARRSIYERARKALLGQLRRVEPPVPEDDIQRENDALDAAIARLEGELETGRAPAKAPRSPPPAAPPAAPRPSPAAPPPVRTAAPRAPAPAAPPPPAPVASTSARATPAPQAPVAPAARPAVPPPAPRLPVPPPAGRSPPPPAAPVAPPPAAPKGVVPPRVEPTLPAPERPVARPGLASNIARERIWPPPTRAPGTEAPVAPPVVTSKAPNAPVAGDVPVPPVVARTPDAVQAAPARPVLPIVEPEAKSAPSADEPFGVPAPSREVEHSADKEPGALSKLRLFGRSRGKAQPDTVPSFDQALDTVGDEPADLPAPREPQGNESLRPIAPQPKVQRTSNLRYWLFAAILLFVVGGIATLAFRLRDNPEDFARVTRPNPATESSDSSGKIVERIGAGPSAGSQRATTPAPAAPAGDTRAPATQPSTAPAVQTPFVPVAHRAALLLEAPDDPQRVRTFVGTVLWRIDRTNSGPPALVADIDLPEARFKASMRISKNTDPRLPASHTIDLRFTPAPDGDIPDVKEIDTLQMRAEDRPAGEPLAGIPAAITANYFLIGLSGSDSAQSRNLELMRNRGWFDLPMLLVNGKIAKITFEKGATGDRMLNDVLAAWKSS